MTPAPTLLFPTAGDPLTLILKPAGSRCNIDCLYCYDKRRELADTGYLDLDVLTRFLSLASGHPLNVVFHGGEPLVTPVHRLAEYVDAFKCHDQPVTFGIVTNGTLLTEKLITDLQQACPGIRFTVSYDGPQQSSQFRVDHRGQPTVGPVERALELLSEMALPTGVITVATRALLGAESALLDSLSSYPAVNSLKITPCLDYGVQQSSAGSRLRSKRTISILAGQEGQAAWALSPAEYNQVVLRASGLWKARGYFKQFILEPFMSILLSLRGADSGSTDFSEVKQPFMVTLSATGLLSTSDEFETAAGLIGPIRTLEEPIRYLIPARLDPLWNQCQGLLASCTSCSHRSTCRGGGLPDRLAYDGATREQYCQARRALIDGIAELIDTS